MLRPEREGDAGFTLVELLTVMAIIGILVATAIASFVLTGERSRAVACRQNQSVLESATTVYAAGHDGDMPPSLDAIRSSVRWASGSSFATCLTAPHPALLYDPDTGDVDCPIHPDD